MSLGRNDAHELEALSRLALQYVGQPRLEALVRIFAAPVQELEGVLWDLATKRSVDTAEGAFLDALGGLVGAPRQGLDDTNYRAVIRAQIRVNASAGGPDDVYAIVVAALGNPTGSVARLEYHAPASFELTLLAPLGFDEGILGRLVVNGADAGVRAVVVVPMAAIVSSFTLSGDADNPPVFAAARGFDSAATPGTGTGALARALDETS